MSILAMGHGEAAVSCADTRRKVWNEDTHINFCHTITRQRNVVCMMMYIRGSGSYTVYDLL